MRAVVLAVTVALVASHQINLVPEFTAGKTFVYKYEGLLLGGLPQEGLGKAGIKVSSKVLIRAEAQNTFILKLSDPQIFQCTGIWPQDPCVPASKLTAALNSQLAIPIKFEYSNGVVGKVFAPAGVSATVLNLHRGILNIFQLNLKNTQNVYELHEAGPHGVCKTHYTIREDEKTRQITVAKSKDLNNCHERVIKDIGLAYAETCAECQERRQSLTGTSTYSYIMKPTAAGALISEATVEELHQFSLFNTITGAAQMKAKQTLNLLEVQNTPLSPVSAQYMARGSLKYEFATEILQTPIQLVKINNAEAQIAEVLQNLATNNMAMAHQDAPLKFIQLVQLMRVATFECIQNIWNQHKTKPVYRRWILDTIPVVGTPASVRFLKEKFQADEFAIPELTQALLVGLHLATANPDTIHQTASLATLPKIKAIPVLREVIMLAYGSMIARHCAQDPTCSADLLKPIHDLAAEAISKAEIPEITLALKVLGNAGHPASLKPIMKLLPGFGSAAASMPVRVQVDAILALRNIAKREPKLVQPVALQLFMDKTLHPEVRMVACIALFETKPSVALMTTIANAVDKEADKHVASFTYSYIKSLTKSMAPDLKDVAAAANVAMRILCPKMDRLNYRFSTAYQLDLYLSPLMAGAAGTAFIINDAATILPRAVLAKARAYLAGAAADVLEVGIRTDGLQDAVRKSHPADQNADRITRIKRTMQAIKDWKSMSAKQPLGSVYVKLLGQEIAFANIDKSFIDYIIQQTAQVTRSYAREMKEIVKSLQTGIAFQYAKPILAAELRRIIPTTVGVPMELDFYTAAVAAASVNVKATITPSLPEQLETTSLDQLMKTDFQLQAEARPSVSMQSFAVIGVNTALIQAAVMTRGKIRAVAPAKLAVRADLPKGHFKVEALPISTPDHVADFSLETVAVARNIEDLPNEKVVSLVPAQPSQSESWLPTSIQKTFCGRIPYLSFKGCADITSRNAGFMGYNPFYSFIGQHSARISVARGDGPTLERLEFEVDIGPSAAQKLVKEVSVLKSETQEENFVLMKLREILDSGTTGRKSHSRGSRSSGSSSKSTSSTSSSSSSNSTSSSSSASSVSTGQTSSRSSGSSSNRRYKGTDTYGAFRRFHKNEGMSKSGSSCSVEVLKKQAKFLGDAIPPEFAIVARAVRSDRSVGYLIAGYLDKSTSRSQIVISSIADQGKWKMCADGVLASKHKFSAEVSWGKECQEYNVTFKAEGGVHDSKPALRVEVEWDRLPKLLYLVTSYVKWVSEYIPTYRASQKTGLSIERTDNNKREVAVIVALPTQRSLNIIVRAPKMTLTQMDVQLPVALPIEKDGRIPALQNVDIQSTIKKLDSDIRARNRNAAMETLQKLMQQLQKVGENVLDEMEAAERRSSSSGN
ncbi:vitellogenin-like [Hoplias malabaricus]|uniref:vitellogenin-like n=1 Tax=Hoplias malabaricus TaxID=27720 RepID=UPI00346237C2